MNFVLPHIGRSWHLAGVVLLGLATLSLPTGALHAKLSEADVSGPIRVIDGDTFEIAGTKVRLHAIDAPESDQICETEQGTDWACGGWITKAVTDRYAGEMARCTRLDIDRYGRTVARCTALGGDVSAWLVREGMAFAYVKYGADYAALEREAAATDRGLHAVRLQSPEQHRRSHKKGRTPPSQACRIKGNINAGGTRIFHQPEQAFYDRTRISEAKGERWFCSAAAARAAGWRPARR